MKTKTIIFAVTILFTSASAMADGYWHQLNVQEIARQESNDCKLVGEVVGSSGYVKTTKSIWKNLEK